MFTTFIYSQVGKENMGIWANKVYKWTSMVDARDTIGTCWLLYTYFIRTQDLVMPIFLALPTQVYNI